jgi:hypothetical protein
MMIVTMTRRVRSASVHTPRRHCQYVHNEVAGGGGNAAAREHVLSPYRGKIVVARRGVCMFERKAQVATRSVRKRGLETTCRISKRRLDH